MIDRLRSRSTVRFAVLLIIGTVLGGTLPGAAQFNLPDLVLEKLVAVPQQPEHGMPVELVATIANRGRNAIFGAFNVAFYVDGSLVDSQLVGKPLFSNRAIEASTTWTATEGEHTVRVRVDSLDRVRESDEENNELQMILVVRPPQGVRSITLGLLTNAGRSLQGAGEALQIEPTTDVFQLIAAFKKAFGASQDAYARGAQGLAALTDGLPAPLSEDLQIQAGAETARLYRTLSENFGQAQQGLDRLNLQVLVAAFEEIHTAVAALARLSIAGIDLDGLESSVALMGRALEQTKQLQAALGGQSGVKVEEVTQELLTLLAEIGTTWAAIGAEVSEAGNRRAPRFTDGQGDALRRYRAGERLVIIAPGAQRLLLQIFSADGDPVYTAGIENHTLVWRGTDEVGAPLSPGRYFYRLLVANGEGAWAELGLIVIGEAEI